MQTIIEGFAICLSANCIKKMYCIEKKKRKIENNKKQQDNKENVYIIIFEMTI